MPELPHIYPDERGALEDRMGVTFCRRCGNIVVNDKIPFMVTKPCKFVKVGSSEGTP